MVTVRLGSEYASVIINLISTSSTQLYRKATKINEIFIGTPHFFLKLVQKDKFMSNESHTQAFWLVPNVTNPQNIPSPGCVTKFLYIVSFTPVDVISDERPKLSTK